MFIMVEEIPCQWDLAVGVPVAALQSMALRTPAIG